MENLQAISLTATYREKHASLEERFANRWHRDPGTDSGSVSLPVAFWHPTYSSTKHTSPVHASSTSVLKALTSSLLPFQPNLVGIRNVAFFHLSPWGAKVFSNTVMFSSLFVSYICLWMSLWKTEFKQQSIHNPLNFNCILQNICNPFQFFSTGICDQCALSPQIQVVNKKY